MAEPGPAGGTLGVVVCWHWGPGDVREWPLTLPPGSRVRDAIEQLADPKSIYRQPATSFVLGFVGLSSRLAGKVVASEAGIVTVDTALGPLRGPGQFVAGADVLLAVRPERIRAGEGENRTTATLLDAVFQGSKVQLHFKASDGDQLMAETADLESAVPPPGSPMTLGWAIADTLVYPAGPA